MFNWLMTYVLHWVVGFGSLLVISAIYIVSLAPLHCLDLACLQAMVAGIGVDPAASSSQ